MKILHTLVGYLAVTTLPFHPFGFASPLVAIDYDGYVNTTQNHKDYALIKRVPGDVIEARQWEIPIATLVSFIVSGIILTLVFISDDNPVRGNDEGSL